MMTVVFAAIIVLLSRLVHAWVFSKEEPEGFNDGVGEDTFVETKEPYSAGCMSGDFNCATGKNDSGLDPGGLYYDD